MEFEITVTSPERPLTLVSDYLSGQKSCSDVALEKRNQSEQSAYDTVAFAVQVGGAIGTVAAGLKLLLGQLGARARVTIRKNGSVIAKNVTSEDAARIVEAQMKK